MHGTLGMEGHRLSGIPSHTFDAEGTYTVTLSVTNALGSDDEIKTGYITVTPPITSHAGVAITFDDDTVDQWYATRSIFQKYNAHATFFVSGFASLDQSEIDKLKILQAEGHEIAYHGYNHVDEVEYIQDNSLNAYMNDEIIRGVNLMKSKGLNPVDFAYPFGSDDPDARPDWKAISAICGIPTMTGTKRYIMNMAQIRPTSRVSG